MEGESLKFASGQSIYPVELISNGLDELEVFLHSVPVPDVCGAQIFGGIKENGDGGGSAAALEHLNFAFGQSIYPIGLIISSFYELESFFTLCQGGDDLSLMLAVLRFLEGVRVNSGDGAAVAGQA